MIVSLIAAMAENRVIGKDGRVPWRLPADMKHFKTLTTGHTVVMGRKTFETLDRPLVNRRNVVVTHNPDYHAAGAEVVHSLAAALDLAAGDDEVFVAGGEEIYRLALPRADRIYLTVVHATVDGDAHFPDFDLAEWRLVGEERYESDERHAFAFTFRRHDRHRTR